MGKTVKILLDQGHYGKYNRSPGVPEYYESDFTFKFADMLKKELEVFGIVVGLTRSDKNKDLALFTRGSMAKGYDLFISLHSNAVGSGVNNSVDYPVAITMVHDGKTNIDEQSKVIGEKLVKVVQDVMGTRQGGRTYTKLSADDRDGNGILDDEWYGVLNGAKSVNVPGIILEHSFHTCNRSAEWLLNETNLRRLAKAEAKCIAEHFGVEDQAAEVPKETTKPKVDIWYRVRKSWADKASQIGAYSVKENALKNCPEGYSVFDENGNAVYTNQKAENGPNTIYRVRKSWEDKNSQIGSYRVYDRAVSNCPRGYAVFDGNGKVMYRNVATTEYKVQKGDTLSEIAQKYGTTVNVIVSANKARYPKITESFIMVGWKLIIY